MAIQMRFNHASIDKVFSEGDKSIIFAPSDQAGNDILLRGRRSGPGTQGVPLTEFLHSNKQVGGMEAIIDGTETESIEKLLRKMGHKEGSAIYQIQMHGGKWYRLRMMDGDKLPRAEAAVRITLNYETAAERKTREKTDKVPTTSRAARALKMSEVAGDLAAGYESVVREAHKVVTAYMEERPVGRRPKEVTEAIALLDSFEALVMAVNPALNSAAIKEPMQQAYDTLGALLAAMNSQPAIEDEQNDQPDTEQQADAEQPVTEDLPVPQAA